MNTVGKRKEWRHATKRKPRRTAGMRERSEASTALTEHRLLQIARETRVLQMDSSLDAKKARLSPERSGEFDLLRNKRRRGPSSD
jgi:hypothetical protein